MQDKYYRVDILESEKGWGSKIDSSTYYKKLEDALAESKEYNSNYNTETVAPDWYMMALPPVMITDFVTVTNLNDYFHLNPEKIRCSDSDWRVFAISMNRRED